MSHLCGTAIYYGLGAGVKICHKSLQEFSEGDGTRTRNHRSDSPVL